MKKIILNKYQTLYYFIWDNNESTLESLREYLKMVKGSDWSCGRCWNEETQANTDDTIFISLHEGTSTTSAFFRVGEYVLDNGNFFNSMSKQEFEFKFLS